MKQNIRVKRAIFGFIPALALLLFFVNLAVGQTNEGQMAGNVVDTTGAQVANAKITAKNEATGSTYNTVSTSNGSYRFPSIGLGRYTVTAIAPGFSPSVSTGVSVRVSSVTNLDIQLTVGAATETVTVAANAPTV